MNPIIETLLRSLFKIGAGYLIAKGLMTESVSQEAIGALLTLISIGWGVWHQKRNGATPSINTGKLGLWLTIGLASFTLAGCSTPQQTAYKTSGIIIVSVDTVMQAYGDCVRAGKVNDADQAKVKKAYEIYRQSILIEKAAVMSYLKNGDKDAYAKTLNAVSDSSSEVIGLVRQIVNLNHK